MKIRCHLAIILVIVPLFLIGAFFKSASGFRATPSPAPTAVAKVTPKIQQSQVKSELLWLRDSTIKRRHLLYSVNYTGPESKIFKHWQSKLIPNVCQQITSIKIQSPAPSYALTLTATCLDRSQGNVAMDIAWAGRGAAISFPAYNAREEVELF